jgi:hypothetical protein
VNYENEQLQKRHEVFTTVSRWIAENGGVSVNWDGKQYFTIQGHVSTIVYHDTREQAYAYALGVAARHFVNKENRMNDEQYRKEIGL